ncbi:hypothetical protein Bca4012_037101 [Brassica carinata]
MKSVCIEGNCVIYGLTLNTNSESQNENSGDSSTLDAKNFMLIFSVFFFSRTERGGAFCEGAIEAERKRKEEEEEEI